MYITVNDIKGEATIDLSYSIQKFDSSMEITVIRMLSDNVKYEILKLHAVMDPISNTKNDDSKWNLCRWRVTLHCRRDG